MKKLIYLIIVVPLINFGQIPVTDGATNSSLVITNTTLNQVNLQIKKLGAQMTNVNQNLEKLINLIEKNNELTNNSKEILKEELMSKKIAPDYVVKSMEISLTLKLKDKIIEAYRGSENVISDFKYLDKKDKKEFMSYSVNAMIETNRLFKEFRTILSTRSLILPEERLKRINDINEKLKKLLDGLIAYQERLRQRNHTREIRMTLINLNKN